jgi:peptidoglycan/xylan/chitin deacetylase (PgdA/CDA1 family)
MTLQMAIKVDVDTWIGLKEGVPNLLALFRRYAIPASFFVAFGPDNSGQAIRRIFKRGFLHKMWRTNAVRTYGLKTLLYGTVLRPPIIGQMAPELFGHIVAEGHELGIHGYDHVRWQDRLDEMAAGEVAHELERAISLYAMALQHPPYSTAAPGWQVNATSLAIQDRLHFRYCSDTRGSYPFLPVWQGRAFETLQIPSTLPTLDEVLGREGRSGDTLNQYFMAQLRCDRLNVHTIHAEVEGRGQLPLFEALLKGLESAGACYVKLCDVAEALLSQERQQLPRASIQRRSMPGRAGVVACQIVHDPT